MVKGAPFTLQRRDLATGWVLAERPTTRCRRATSRCRRSTRSAGDAPPRPLLIGAKPFHLLRFAAPPEGARDAGCGSRSKLATDANSLVILRPRLNDFPLPDNTTVGIWPTSRRSPAQPDRKDDPAAAAARSRSAAGPLRRRRRSTCTMQATADMMAGGHARRSRRRSGRAGLRVHSSTAGLTDRLGEGQPTDQLVLQLRDLGKADEGCKPASAATAIPRRLAVKPSS